MGELVSLELALVGSDDEGKAVLLQKPLRYVGTEVGTSPSEHVRPAPYTHYWQNSLVLFVCI